MAIQYGNTAISAIKYCNSSGTLVDVQSVQRNGATVFGRTITPNYLRFTAVADGTYVNFQYASGSDVTYRINGGAWESCPSNVTIPLLNADDYVELRGIGVTTNANRHFTFCKAVLASGSVTSLTDGIGLDENVVLTESCYSYMFNGCAGTLKSAPSLIAKTLANNCYECMFVSCPISSIALPATTMVYRCYRKMFWMSGVTSITTNQTDFSNQSCTGWLDNVKSGGTFHCTSALESVISAGSRSGSTVPSNWTVAADIS